MSSKDSDFPCVRWGDVPERFEHSVPGLYFEQLAAWPVVVGRDENLGVCTLERQ